MSTPIDKLLSALPSARQHQPSQWMARCPAHDDKSPSLSIRETPEGAVLVHCFAGCTAAEVVSAVGLDLADLFPPKDRPATAPKRTSSLLTPKQALNLLHDEAQLVGICAGNIGHGVVLTEIDRQRVLQAAGRIAYIRQTVMS